ncbi:Heptosyltransferase II [Ignavibacterium album JCM 16511]|uniref:Heptosyltransferase II n=1 Tax=Ignavibacterium album (strain DSM 19864 / JCM 16511 / NBRC 101810 / Mat9-16) TaxID=945713 RepID=I0AKB3_IGNAJ|nr:glycosyltransferase family 9 protein [Ignavibacterium album]AFH49420.1 Heptosyltransferase II [Ignavibacterium album JCM 16511]
MLLKPDCAHFQGDRPCFANKQFGKTCNDCEYYKKIGENILIIKFDAIGDVLRTTSILPAVKRNYPESRITWLTKSNATDIFIGNKFVDEVLAVENNFTLPKLLSQNFDLILHPDSNPVSSAYAKIISAKEKRGFTLDDKGKVQVCNEEAIEWFEMGAFDQLKKINQKTYQQIIHSLLKLNYSKDEIILSLTGEEKQFAERFYDENSLYRFKFIVGLNTGGSRRWKYKKWRIDGFKEVINELSNYPEIGILLFGGEIETELVSELKSFSDRVIDTGTKNSLREFFALMDLVDILVTGDTLALHVATALKKNVICLFGPTSSAEIEDYGRIIKITPDMDCLVCYKQDCDFVPNCMDKITSDMILEKINSLIKF